MDFREISLGDKPLFDKWFQQMQPKISELSFTNLFLWQKTHSIFWRPWGDGAFLAAKEHEEMVFLPPVGIEDCKKAFQDMLVVAKSEGIKSIVRIPEWAKRFLPPKGHVYPQREHFDYVYKAVQLAELKGWRLDGKRAFVRKFQQAYPSWQFVVYDDSMRKACMKLFDTWRQKQEGSSGIEAEYHAFGRLLENFSALNVQGGVLFVDGEAVGFSFGEKQNETTFVTHFEKADTSYVGAYQMVNQQTAQHMIAPFYLLVNREQDLGIEGLRKAKQSYAPLKLVKKYRYDRAV